VQRVQVAAGPEGFFKFDGQAACRAHREQLAEDIGPAGQRNNEQQRHDQLHDQVRVGDEGQEGEVLSDVHVFI
jgi:hypothetical protein